MKEVVSLIPYHCGCLGNDSGGYLGNDSGPGISVMAVDFLQIELLYVSGIIKHIIVLSAIFVLRHVLDRRGDVTER